MQYIRRLYHIQLAHMYDIVLQMILSEKSDTLHMVLSSFLHI